MTADDLPTITAIIAAKEFVGGEIDTRMRVWTDDERRVPVPSQGIFVATYLGLNAHAFAGAFVKTRQRAVLKFRINDIRIFGIDLRAKAIAAIRNEPVTVHNA